APATAVARSLRVAPGTALGLAAGQRQVLQRQAGPGIDGEQAVAAPAAESDARPGRVARDDQVVAGRDDEGGRPEGERVVGVRGGGGGGLAGGGGGKGEGVAAGGGVGGIDGGPQAAGAAVEGVQHLERGRGETVLENLEGGPGTAPGVGVATAPWSRVERTT